MQAPDAAEPLLACPVSADLGQRVEVPRVRHRTHRGASGPVPREVCNSPSHWTLCGWDTGPSVGASGARRLQVQLAINGVPDALQSTSGATLSASGAPVF